VPAAGQSRRRRVTTSSSSSSSPTALSHSTCCPRQPGAGHACYNAHAAHAAYAAHDDHADHADPPRLLAGVGPGRASARPRLLSAPAPCCPSDVKAARTGRGAMHGCFCSRLSRPTRHHAHRQTTCPEPVGSLPARPVCMHAHAHAHAHTHAHTHYM
jgi:hypothetical protein